MNLIKKSKKKNIYLIILSIIISILLSIIFINFQGYSIINEIKIQLIKAGEINLLRIFIIASISRKYIIKITKKPKKNEITNLAIPIGILLSTIIGIIISILTTINIIFGILIGLFLNILISYLFLKFGEDLKGAKHSSGEDYYDGDYDFDSSSDDDFGDGDFGGGGADGDR